MPSQSIWRFWRRKPAPLPLHKQYPDLMCHVCGGAGNVYQFGNCIQCHACRGAGVTDVPRDGYGEVIAVKQAMDRVRQVAAPWLEDCSETLLRLIVETAQVAHQAERDD